MYYRVPYCCSTSKGCVHTKGAWFDANTPQSTPQSAVTIVVFQELCRRHTVYHSPTGHDRAVNLCRGCGCCVYVCGGMLFNVHVVHAVISFVRERVPSAHRPTTAMARHAKYETQHTNLGVRGSDEGERRRSHGSENGPDHILSRCRQLCCVPPSPLPRRCHHVSRLSCPNRRRRGCCRKCRCPTDESSNHHRT